MRSDFENMDSSYDEAAIWALLNKRSMAGTRVMGIQLLHLTMR